jgi:WD40 repeat protein
LLDMPFVKALAFSPDGKVLVTAGLAPQVWDLETGKPRWPEQRGGSITFLLFFHADGKTFWTVTDSGLFQWDTTTVRLLGGVEHQLCNTVNNSDSSMACGVSADGRRVAVVGERESTGVKFDEQTKWDRTSRRDHEILVWELPTARPDDKEDVRPMAGTPEQINLWLQVQTGRETEEYNPNAPVDKMRIEDWWKCRIKLIADGGLPVPSPGQSP